MIRCIYAAVAILAFLQCWPKLSYSQKVEGSSPHATFEEQLLSAVKLPTQFIGESTGAGQIVELDAGIVDVGLEEQHTVHLKLVRNKGERQGLKDILLSCGCMSGKFRTAQMGDAQQYDALVVVQRAGDTNTKKYKSTFKFDGGPDVEVRFSIFYRPIITKVDSITRDELGTVKVFLEVSKPLEHLEVTGPAGQLLGHVAIAFGTPVAGALASTFLAFF